MWLYIFSNRFIQRYDSISSYPWIIEYYDLNNEKLEEIKYCNFKLPLGMMKLGEKGKKRKNDYLNYYNNIYKKSNLPQEKSNFFTNLFYRDEGNKIKFPMMKYHIYLKSFFKSCIYFTLFSKIISLYFNFN